MPYARISLLQGKPPEYLRALADGIQQALEECFEVPTGDRFQIIHQHAPGEMIFDRAYGGGPRSDDFVLLTLHTGRPRSPAIKAALYARLAERLRQAPGLAPQDLMVVIIDGGMESWSFGHGRPAAPQEQKEALPC